VTADGDAVEMTLDEMTFFDRGKKKERKEGKKTFTHFAVIQTPNETYDIEEIFRTDSDRGPELFIPFAAISCRVSAILAPSINVVTYLLTYKASYERSVAASAQQRSQVISRSEHPRARSPGCTFSSKQIKRSAVRYGNIFILCSHYYRSKAKQ